MKKSLSAALVLFIATTFINGCSVSVNGGSDKPTASDKPSTSTETQHTETDKKSGELTFEKAIMAKKDKETSEYTEADSFKKGDTAGLVFIKVGKFAKDKDGKNQFDLDMELKDAQGKVIYEQTDLLKDAGTKVLDNDTAASPAATLDTGKLEPGKYSLKVTIHDKVSSSQTSATKTFKVE